MSAVRQRPRAPCPRPSVLGTRDECNQSVRPSVSTGAVRWDVSFCYVSPYSYDMAYDFPFIFRTYDRAINVARLLCRRRDRRVPRIPTPNPLT